nr:hypothetical protein [Tanacetum cinerariifolium]
MKMAISALRSPWRLSVIGYSSQPDATLDLLFSPPHIDVN